MVTPGQVPSMSTQQFGNPIPAATPAAANPFTMPGGRNVTAPAPPVMAPRSLPMGPMGGVPPQLAAAIAAWQAAQQAQQTALPPVTPPMTSPPMMPTQQNVPSGFMGLLYRAAQEKFKRGMATPLADKAGWSAGWGDRPLGMQQSPALPNQAQFSGLGDLGGGGGGYTNPVAKPPVY